MFTTTISFIIKRVYLGLPSLPDYVLNIHLCTFEKCCKIITSYICFSQPKKTVSQKKYTSTPLG